MQEIINLTKRFIKNQATGQENVNKSILQAADYLKLNGLEYDIHKNEGYYMITSQIGKGEETIILNGHLDVVEAETHQFNPIIENGNIVGRGSYDMLGACAVMLNVMKELKERNISKKVILMLVPTEETNGKQGTGYLVEKGIVGDFAICGEPTNLQISTMSKGVFRVRITALGKSSHSSRPWLGENAILKCFDIYHKLIKLPFISIENSRLGGSTANISFINGGVAMNVVPDEAYMDIDIRYVPEVHPEDIIEQIKSIDENFNMEQVRWGAAILTDNDNVHVQKLMKTIERIQNKPARLTAQHGAADTKFFQNTGIPSIEFGPCGANHHSLNEYVTIQSLEEYKKILIDFIVN